MMRHPRGCWMGSVGGSAVLALMETSQEFRIVGLLRHDPLHEPIAGEPTHEVDEVDALVEKIAVADAAQKFELANLTRCDRLLQGDELGRVPQLVADDAENAAPGACLSHCPSVGQRQRERLFDDDGAHAGEVGDFLDDGATDLRWRGDDDDFGMRMIEQFRDRRVTGRRQQANSGGEHGRLAIANADELYVGQFRERLPMLTAARPASDQGGPEHHRTLIHEGGARAGYGPLAHQSAKLTGCRRTRSRASQVNDSVEATLAGRLQLRVRSWHSA